MAAPTMGAPASPRRIVILAYAGAHLLNIAGPSEVFAAANRAQEESRAVGPAPGPAPYQLEILSRDGGPIATAAGIIIDTRVLTPDGEGPVDTLIIPGGAGIRAVMADPRTLAWIRATAQHAWRVIGLGGGGFILASAGLLAGRRCVCHWRFEDDLLREYPDVRLVRDALFVTDGRFTTAAGSTASLDVSLRIVEQDLGAGPALHIASMLITPRIRPGDQPQLSAEMRARIGAAPRIARALDWISENLAQRRSVTQMAAQFAMSERTFSRAFHRQTGMSPAAFMEQVRLEAAQRWLAGSTLSVEDVARRCGYSSAAHLTRVLRTRLGLTPLVYRRQMRPD